MIRLLREVMDTQGWTQEILASELGVTQSTVTRWLRGSEPRGDRRDRIVELYRRATGDEPTAATVPLVGRIGAGAAIEAIDDMSELVTAPPGVDPETIAWMVEGESMLPAYEPGTIVYAHKRLPPELMINRRAIIRLGSGDMTLKVLRPGSEPGRYRLVSINSSYSEIDNQEVEWASPIEWTRPPSS